jgi:predicted esterase
MTWRQFSHGLRLDPITKGAPKALVVLLHDFDATAESLTSIAARWAAAVPSTAFVALPGSAPSDLPSDRVPQQPTDYLAKANLAMLEVAALRLAPVIDQQLRSRRLDASRLVLGGFGYGGMLALHMVLCQGIRCAGVLAYSTKPMTPLRRILEVDRKVRLIECIGDRHIGQSSLRDIIELLALRGIDARGVSLVGSALSEEAIRLGGAYLVELVATAQRGDRFPLARENSDAR